MTLAIAEERKAGKEKMERIVREEERGALTESPAMFRI